MWQWKRSTLMVGLEIVYGEDTVVEDMLFGK